MTVTKNTEVLIEGREIWDENGIVEQNLEFAIVPANPAIEGDGLKVSIRVKHADTSIAVYNPFSKKWFHFLKFIEG